MVACSDEGKYKDGMYFAIQDEFSETSGWKSTVTFEIKDGKFVSVDWNAVSIDGGADKVTRSVDGKYPMVENGGAQSPWHEQAIEVESYLIEKQEWQSIEYSDDEGHVDVISGVSVHVNDFFKLVDEALKSAK